MRKIIALTLSTVCILSLVGCGTKNVETKPNTTESEIVETNPSTDNNEQPTESTEIEETTNTILPLPSTINLEALEDSSLAVSFGKENIHKNEDESITIDLTIYAYDMYDMVDIANLKEGDTISINGENVMDVKNQVNNKVIELEGYTSSSDETLKQAKVIYKIPTERLNLFLDYIDSFDGIGSKQISSSDITSSYAYVEAKIQTLMASREAYVKILETENKDSKKWLDLLIGLIGNLIGCIIMGIFMRLCFKDNLEILFNNLKPLSYKRLFHLLFLHKNIVMHYFF